MLPAGEAMTLAIGPEGGFTSHEFDCLVARDFTPVSMGERVLRTEHVVPALLGSYLMSSRLAR